MKSLLKIYTDGGARGNPGPAAAGVVIFNEQGKLIGKYSKFLGETTNNQAEYQAVIFALEKARQLKGTTLKLHLDSEIVVQQLNRKYKIKDSGLAALFVKIWNTGQSFKSIEYNYIPREKNKLADSQVNLCLDQYTKA
ncbi:MAG: ribonuclease H [Candidatus Kerfeldbacteria bacterium CG08_land_8_20_14_0_20_40_16]|uniref:Ribonuclease H n=1 Tax=Candidatus Kerfeldbacteria bacterium CG08_land_8_20_14_0_20_40_16 TaxID=2014244 RepID=A0A2H0YX38_9BACT|nr:MAG: ribonuclease H [Candidatus Kerfeldbacteria bacterium CG08_land_8_20_14_0_20_40_16]